MNTEKSKILDILTELKENYHVVSVKAEFESEGANLEEALTLKKFAKEAGLELSLKIGGCGAVKDIIDTKTIGVNSIIAPMIESVYGGKKFINSVKKIYSTEEYKKIKLLINIETISGFNCLDEILNEEYSKDISGIVLGRSDMLGSLNMDSKEVNSDKMLEISQSIAAKALKHNKEFVIGGKVSGDSIQFLKRITKEALTKFETRKIIFNAQELLSLQNINTAIHKALEFEIMWLKFCNKDPERIKELQKLF